MTTIVRNILEMPKLTGTFLSNSGATTILLIVLAVTSWRWFFVAADAAAAAETTTTRSYKNDGPALYQATNSPHYSATRTTTETAATYQDPILSVSIVPFILLQEPSKVSTSSTIHYALEQYRKEITQALQGSSHLLEQALFFEEQQQQNFDIPEPARLSTKVRYRIEKMAQCLEQNAFILQSLLSDLPYVMALPAEQPSSTESSLPTTKENKNHSKPYPDHDTIIYDRPYPSTIFQVVDENNKNDNNNINNINNNNNNKQRKKQPDNNINVYDSANQIVAHLVRDWTSSGTNLRRNLYGWCRRQLQLYVTKNNNDDADDNNNNSNNKTTVVSPKTVFVPGAGMGRLSFDIWRDGYTVEANELSPVMAAAAHGILQRNVSGVIHPFALDVLANEVDAERRYDAVHFPNISNIDDDDEDDDDDGMEHNKHDDNNEKKNNTLSFTIGDFVGGYYDGNSSFDAVVTCFFIDTATNIYEYIRIIHTMLKKSGGVWINVGPVQWHGNAILRPSVDELRDLLGAIFDIVHWSVDTEPIPYRQDEGNHANGFVRSTDFSSYRPLRFVVVKR